MMNRESEAMQALPEDDPVMIAWEGYRRTSEYANTRKWALLEEHVDGSLWSAFLRGWFLSQVGCSEKCKVPLWNTWRIRRAQRKLAGLKAKNTAVWELFAKLDKVPGSFLWDVRDLPQEIAEVEELLRQLTEKDK